MAEGTQLPGQIEELNKNLKLISSALVDLTEQLRELQESKLFNSSSEVPRTSGYVNWNSTHDVLKTEKWVSMSAFLECLKAKSEKLGDFLEDTTIQAHVDEETRFPEDDLYVNLDNPFVRAKLLYVDVCKDFAAERILNISKGEAHTVSSFEKEHGLKWVDRNIVSEVSSDPVPVPTAKPVSKTVSNDSAPKPWVSEEPNEVDSDEPKTSTKKEDQKLYTNIAKILDRINENNFNFLKEAVKEQFLKLNNQKQLEFVTELMYDNVVEKRASCKVYGKLARTLIKTKVPSDNDPNKFVSFRGFIISKFQTNFEEMVKIQRTFDYNDEKNMANRTRNVAIVTFIGEMYIVDMLSSNIIDHCLKELIKDETNEKLECFCELIATVGKKFDNSENNLETHFKKLQHIIYRADKYDNINDSVKQMIRDIIDLRNRKWTKASQLIKNMPKTLDEIQDENHKRALLIQLMNEFGTSGIEQKEQTEVSHKKHKRQPAGVNLYSVEALKLEGASQKTQDYIREPPECFTELDDEILDKLQADGAIRKDMIINEESPLQKIKKMQNLIGKIRYTIDQHIVSPDDEELVFEFAVSIPPTIPKVHAAVVSIILDIVLQKSVKEVTIFANSFAYCVVKNTFEPDDVLAGLKTTLDDAPDLIIDIPILYGLLGIFIAPLIVTDQITFVQIFEVSQTVIESDQGNRLLTSIIETLLKTDGFAVTRALWIKSGMRVSQWMEEKLVPPSIAGVIEYPDGPDV